MWGGKEGILWGIWGYEAVGVGKGMKELGALTFQ